MSLSTPRPATARRPGPAPATGDALTAGDARAVDGVPRRRRRGAALEEVLLDEAWTQLRERGYGAFMIDAVARAAGTSRAVVYRRWPNKASLIHAAIRAHAGTVLDEIPDTGSLALDLRTVLKTLAARMDRIGADTMTGLLSDLDELPPDVAGSVRGVVEQLLAQARSRGEISGAPIPEAVCTAPTDLLRYHMLAERALPSDEAIDAIVDQVFLPLVGHYAPPARR